MSSPSTPFPWKGDARRAGGWPKAKESEANLRRYAPPPSKGRREYPREPLPLEGAAEHSEAGLASFLGGEAASSLPSPLGKGDRVSGG